MSCSPDTVTDWTDAYFNRTKAAVAYFGDVPVTYAVFMRRPVVTAPRLALDWLTRIGRERGVEFNVEICLIGDLLINYVFHKGNQSIIIQTKTHI